MSKKRNKNSRKLQLKKKQARQVQKLQAENQLENEESFTLFNELYPSKAHQNLSKELDYDITWEPLPDEWEDTMPDDILKRTHEIYHDLHDNPENYIDELIALDIEYPNCRTLTNYLVAAYTFSGKKDMALAQMKVNLSKYPDYLFAKIQLAQYYISLNQFKEVDALFDNKFDLKELFPDRDVFHITEVEGMLHVAASWFEWKDDHDKFLFYYEILTEISPDSSVTMQLTPKATQIRLFRLSKLPGASVHQVE